MEVKTCKNCGRLFNYIGGSYKTLCPHCIDVMEEKFQDVKHYIERNPKCTMNEVCEEFEISSKQIERWIKEERLCFAEDSPIGIACERCGTMIRTGKFCANCQNDLKTQISGLYQAVNRNTQKRNSSNKMRFLDNE